MSESSNITAPQTFFLQAVPTTNNHNHPVAGGTNVVPTITTISPIAPVAQQPVQLDKEAVASLAKELFDQMSQTTEQASEQNNTTVASHDEADDVRLVDEVISKLRELLVREAQDGDSIWQLSDIIDAIKAVDWVKWNEQQDVIDQELPVSAFASVEDELFTGSENMAISEEAKAELNEAVASAVTPVLEAMTKNSEALANLTELLAKTLVTPAPAPAAEAINEVETPVTEETPAAEATPVVETPVAEAETPTADAAFPPEKDDMEDEEEDDESKASTTFDGNTAEASIEEEVPVEFSGFTAASQFVTGTSTVLLHTTEGRKKYLEGVAKANRIPVGVTNTIDDNKGVSNEQLIGELVNIFRRK
jgi:hypothetical protein